MEVFNQIIIYLLIYFQKYLCGRNSDVLKWKPASVNSVDFKLMIYKENRPG